MGFMDEVAQYAAYKKKCKLAEWLENDPGAKGLTVEGLIQAREEYSLKALWNALHDRGYQHSQETISDHLRGVCRCPKTS